MNQRSYIFNDKEEDKNTLGSMPEGFFIELNDDEIADIYSDDNNERVSTVGQQTQTGGAPQTGAQREAPIAGDLIAGAAYKAGFDEPLLRAVDTQETGLGTNLVSETGVRGRGQLTMEVANKYGVDREDPEQALYGSAMYLKDLSKQFDGDIAKTLGAYNGGAGVVREASELAEKKGTYWLDEIQNTKAIDSVARRVARYSSTPKTFDQARKEKINEIRNYVPSVLSKYENYVNEDIEITDDDIAYGISQLGITEDESDGYTEFKDANVGTALGQAAVRTADLGTNAVGFIADLAKTGHNLSGKAFIAAMEKANLPKPIIDVAKLQVGSTNAAIDLLSSGIDVTTDFTGNLVEEIPTVQGEYGNVKQAFKSGFFNGLEYVALSGLENSGTTAAFIAASATGVGAAPVAAGLALGAAGQKNKELEDRIASGELVMNEGVRYLNSTLTGASEVLPEYFLGSAQIVKAFRKSLGKTAVSVAKKAAKEIGKKGATEAVRAAKKSALATARVYVTNIGKAWGMEFTDENITEISNNIIDKATGVTPQDDKTLRENIMAYVTDTAPELAASTWVGGAMGGVSARGQLRQQSFETTRQASMIEMLDSEGVSGEDIANTLFSKTDPSQLERVLTSFEKYSIVDGPVNSAQEVIENIRKQGLSGSDVVNRLLQHGFDPDAMQQSLIDNGLLQGPETQVEEEPIVRIPEEDITDEDMDEDADIEADVDEALGTGDELDTQEDLKQTIIAELTKPSNEISDETREESDLLEGQEDEIIEDQEETGVIEEGTTEETASITEQPVETPVEQPEAEEQLDAQVDEPTTEQQPAEAPTDAQEGVIETVEQESASETPVESQGAVKGSNIKQKTKDRIVTELDKTAVNDSDKANIREAADLAGVFDADAFNPETDKIDNARLIYFLNKEKRTIDKKSVTRPELNKLYKKLFDKEISKNQQIYTISTEILEEVGTERALEQLRDIKRNENTRSRVIGALDITTGQGVLRRAKHTLPGDFEYTPDSPVTYVDKRDGKEHTGTMADFVESYNKYREQIESDNTKKTKKMRLVVKTTKDGLKYLEHESEQENKEAIYKNKGEVQFSDKMENLVPAADPTEALESLGLSGAETAEVKNIITGDTEVKYDPKKHDKILKTGMFETYDVDGQQYIEFARNKPIRYNVGENKTKVPSNTRAGIKAMMKSVSMLFPKDDIDIRFGSKENPIMDDRGRVLDDFSDGSIGGYVGYNGKPLITINVGKENTDTFKTFIHESVGHFGVDKVFDVMPELDIYAKSLFKRDSNSDLVKDLKSKYKKDELYSEWLAYHIQEAGTEFFNKDGSLNENRFEKADSIAKKLYNKLREILGRLFKMAPTAKEIKELTDSIFSEVRKQAPKPAMYDTQEQTERKRQKPVSGEEYAKNMRKQRSHDRLLLETAKTLVGTKNRILKYIDNHIGNPAEKEKLKLVANKIDTVDKKDGKYVDLNMRRVLALIDDNNTRGELSRGITGLKKQISRITTKMPVELKRLANDNKLLVKRYELWRSLGVYKRASEVRVYKDDGVVKNKKVSLNNVDKSLLEGGFIAAQKTRIDPSGNLYTPYKLTEKGNDAYMRISDMYKTNTIKIQDMDGSIKKLTVDFRGMIAHETTKLKEKIKDFKDESEERKEKRLGRYKERASSLIQQIELEKSDKSIWGKYRRSIRSMSKNTLIKELRKVKSFFVDDLRFVVENLDGFEDNGFFKKYIFDPIVAGEERATEVKKEALENMREELAGVSTKKMADFFSADLISRVRKMSKKGKEKLVPTQTFKDKFGKSFDLTTDQRIAVYRISRTQNGIDHLLSDNGGFVLSEKTSYEKFYPDPSTIEAVVESVRKDKDAMSVSNALDKHFDYLKDKINEVSMKELGYEIATEELYHPLLTLSLTETSDQDLKNVDNGKFFRRFMTFNNLLARTNAKNPLVLEGAMAAAGRTIDMTSDYIGKSIPARDIINMMDGVSVKVDGQGGSVKLSRYLIENGFGAEQSIIMDYLTKYQGLDSDTRLRSDTELFKFLKFTRNMFVVGALGLNQKVSFTQRVSYIGSNTVHGYDYTFGMGSKPATLKKMFSDFVDNSMVLYDRIDRGMDRDHGEAINSGGASWLFNKDTRINRSFFSYAKEGRALSSKAFMSPITNADAQTIGLIINDITQGVIKEHGVKYGTKEFFDIAVPLLNETIRRTQPVYSPVARPLAMSKEFYKPVTMFITQPVKNLQNVRMGIMQIVKGISRNDTKLRNDGFNKLVQIGVLQPAIYASLQTMHASMMGYDDDDDGFIKGAIKTYFKGMLGMYPIIGAMITDLLKLTKRRGNVKLGGEIAGVSALSDIYSFTNTLYKYARGKDITYRKNQTNEEVLTQRALDLVSNFGVPKNAVTIPMKYTKSVIEMIEDSEYDEIEY